MTPKMPAFEVFEYLRTTVKLDEESLIKSLKENV